METLEKKLKVALVQSLRSMQNADKPYLATQKKLWTANELADEIEKETEQGVKRMVSILKLSIHLLNKKKIK